MIVRMRKLSILLYHEERGLFLSHLQRLGVLHVAMKTGNLAPDLEEKIKLQKRIQSIMVRLKRYLPGKKVEESRTNQDVLSLQNILSEVETLEKRLEEFSETRLQLNREQAQLLPWGDFEPELILKLRQAGINVRLFEVSLRQFKSLSLHTKAAEVIYRDNHKAGFVVFDWKEKTDLPFEELPLPKRSLSLIARELAGLEQAEADIRLKLKVLTQALPFLSKEADLLQDDISFEKTMLGFEPAAGGKVLLLSGWLPAEKEEQVKTVLHGYSAYFEFSDPVRNDRVPVLLRNNRFSALFEPITRIFSLPHYDEFDPTPFFAPFFALYVGLCLGDVAYGIIIFLVSLIVSLKGPVAIRAFARLFMVLGLTTLLGGLLLNSLFSHTLFGGSGVPEGSSYFNRGAGIFSPLSPVQGQQGMVFPAMKFALLIGCLQVLFGMGLRAVNRWQRYGAIFALQPISYMMMILGGFVWMAHVNFMNLGIGEFSLWYFNVGAGLTRVPLVFGKGITLAGLGIFIIFNNPDKPYWLRLTFAGLWDFYGFISGFLGDLLSYLRLFALGLSGGLLGGAFNYIALMFITGKDGQLEYVSPMILFTVLFLIIGHIMNLCLSMIGAFVHPLRLTFVEFYKNLDFQGGGLAYAPFKLNESTRK